MTNREKILLEIKTRLEKLYNSSIPVFRSLVFPQNRGDLPAIAVFSGEENIETLGLDVASHSFMVIISILTRTENVFDSADSSADEFILKINSSILEKDGDGISNLGGLCAGIFFRGIDRPVLNDTDMESGFVSANYEVKFLTMQDNIDGGLYGS